MIEFGTKNVSMSGVGVQGGLKVLLEPVFHIYTALKISFVAVFAESEATADGLNPLTKSHIGKINSNKPPGIYKTNARSEPKITNKPPVNKAAYPMKPKTDSQRGMSFDL